MIIDTSALVAILFNEPDAHFYAERILNADACLLSAASYVELSIVVENQLGSEGHRQCEALLRQANITIEPVSVDQATLARDAYFDFGKRRHPAGLNYGDCFAYALAKSKGEPLLFKGNDFSQTDIAPAA